MKHRICYSPEARRDLDEIWDYIRYSLQNPSAAEHTVHKIMDHIDRLEMFAEIGTPLASIANVASDERFLVTGTYLTFYRVQRECVYIDRILNGRSDHLRILLQTLDEQSET